jgi:hypothetical protein
MKLVTEANALRKFHAVASITYHHNEQKVTSPFGTRLFLPICFGF